MKKSKITDVKKKVKTALEGVLTELQIKKPGRKTEKQFSKLAKTLKKEVKASLKKSNKGSKQMASVAS